MISNYQDLVQRFIWHLQANHNELYNIFKGCIGSRLTENGDCGLMVYLEVGTHCTQEQEDELFKLWSNFNIPR